MPTGNQGNDGDGEFAGENGLASGGVETGADSVPPSICKGTRYYRPKIDALRTSHLVKAAQRRGCQTLTIVNDLIDRMAAGNLRGPGRNAEQHRAVEELLRHLILGLILHEGAIVDFLTGLKSLSGTTGLVAAEKEDYLASLAGSVLDAVGALRRDVSALRESLKSKDGKGRAEP